MNKETKKITLKKNGKLMNTCHPAGKTKKKLKSAYNKEESKNE